MSNISAGDILIVDELGRPTLVLVSSVKGFGRKQVRGYTKGCKDAFGEELKYLSTKKRATLKTYGEFIKYEKKDPLLRTKLKNMLSKLRLIEGIDNFLLLKWTFWFEKEMILPVSRMAITHYCKKI